MRNLAIVLTATLAVLFVGLLALNAEATTVTGSAVFGAKAKNYSPMVQETACRGWGPHCPPGFHWVCGPRRCWCAPC
jgi:hypothetical protein